MFFKNNCILVYFFADSDGVLEIKKFSVDMPFLWGGCLFYICHFTYTRMTD